MMSRAQDLPVRPSEAAALADAVFQVVQEDRVGPQVRARLAERIASLGLGGLQAYAFSLAADPLENSGYYIAADALPNGIPVPLLLHFALASASGNGHFRDAALIGRMRPGGGREIAVSAIPFSMADRDNIAAFVEHIERAYLPRPQGAEPSLSLDLAADGWLAQGTLEGFRKIQTETGWNAAAAHCDLSAGSEAAVTAYYSQIWAAIRTGWREGYSLEADRIGLPADPQAVASLTGFTGFSVDAAPLLDMRGDHRSAGGWSEPDIMRLYEEGFPPELRSWAESEFERKTEIGGVTYTFARHEIRRLAVKFGPALLACEAAFDVIGGTRKEPFDFEIAIDRCETLTTAKELIFCLQWMRQRGRPVQSMAANVALKPQGPYPENMQQLVDYTRPKLWIDLAPRVAVQFNADPMAELSARTGELSAVARHLGSVLSVYGGRETQPAAIQAIGRGANCMLHYKLTGPVENADRLISAAHSLRS